MSDADNQVGGSGEPFSKKEQGDKPEDERPADRGPEHDQHGPGPVK